jgi:hypothetical protein
MYTFRGYDPERKRFVYGKGIDQTKFSTRIHVESLDVWTYVTPNTVGIESNLGDPARTKIYQGDIVKYSFKERGEIFNRYFVVKQNKQNTYCEELWRDYDLDNETFEVTRTHNTKYAGDIKAIDSFFITRCVCTVVGNVWQNPELM